MSSDKWFDELIETSGAAKEEESAAKRELARMRESGIDVIIPVYRGISETADCIKSVLSDSSFPLRVTVIADCPPEDGMNAALEEIAERSGGRMTLIKHSENLGFVKTVNEGMRLTHGDVVLLNSDTLVASGWLYSLCAAAASAEDIATATPLSTSAGPFTLFSENQISRQDFPIYAEAVSKLHKSKLLTVPTGHGYCIFIKRKAIESVGLFNEKVFGRGYGEENDFCQRAIEMGFTNAADFGTLVYHAEALSFGEEKTTLLKNGKALLAELHPSYKQQIASCFHGKEWQSAISETEAAVQEYIKHNPVCEEAPKKRLLVAMHAGAGGSVNNRLDMMRALSDRYDSYMLAGDMKSLCFSYIGRDFTIPIETIALESPLTNLTFERADLRRIYEGLLLRHKIDAVNMSHLLGETFDLVKLCRQLGIPCIYVLHDFYTLCPDFMLTDSNMVFCGGKCREDCTCVVSKEWVKLPKNKIHNYVSGWRMAMREYLPLFDMLCAPDSSVKNTFAEVYPELAKRVRIIEHGRDLDVYGRVNCRYPRQGERIKIAVIGNMSPAKGVKQLEALLRADTARRLELHIFGDISHNAQLDGAIRHGKYERDKLSEMLSELEPAYGLLPGAVAETYCHTLTELWAMGIPVIAASIGALKTRMEKTKAGWLFPVRDTEALYKLITEGISEEQYDKARANALALTFPTTAEMAAEYEKPLFLGEGLKTEDEQTHIERTNLMKRISLFSGAEAEIQDAEIQENADNSITAAAQSNLLKRQVKELKKELKHSLTCYRRQIGDAIVDAWMNKRLLIKLPARLLKINRDYRRAGQPVNEIKLQKTAAAAAADAAKAGVPEKLTLSSVPSLSESTEERSVDIIICIHNALADVSACLQSLVKRRTFPYGIIIVDDGSDAETAKFLAEFAQGTDARLIRHENGMGYTISANEGLRLSSADYRVLLNSDTIVTDRFAEKMIRAFESDKSIGVLSPLSNAATYQSIPEIRSGSDWAINDLPEGLNADAVNLAAERSGKPTYPHLKCVNGFCFMISRRCIDRIGFLDEENFPKGYGEEVDYCLRAENAGIKCCVLDDTYIFHAKSKSFTNEGRKLLTTSSKPALRAKHGEKYDTFAKAIADNEEMRSARERVMQSVNKMQELLKPLRGKRIVFILPARYANGGTNSVCQEVQALRALGIDAKVANKESNKGVFMREYEGCGEWTMWFINTPEELAHAADIVVATIFTTVKYIVKMKRKNRNLKSAYYVQDYEPLFFESGSDNNLEALSSYTADKKMLLFAKTDWICETVEEKHGKTVKRVMASVDWKVYNPYRTVRREAAKTPVISAMVRPSTQRRNPAGTLKALRRIKERLGENVNIRVFGCSDDELARYAELTDFELINSGRLKRFEAAELLAQSDVFIDMSTYQAFGRTGIEAMALGCVPLLPEIGGAREYAVDGKNAIIADTSDPDSAADKVIALLGDRSRLEEMSAQALETAKRYNAFTAACSEAELFAELINDKTKRRHRRC